MYEKKWKAEVFVFALRNGDKRKSKRVFEKKVLTAPNGKKKVGCEVSPQNDKVGANIPVFRGAFRKRKQKNERKF